MYNTYMGVRKIKKSYISSTGHFKSYKNDKLIEYESILERDFYMTLEFDNEVLSYLNLINTFIDSPTQIYLTAINNYLKNHSYPFKGPMTRIYSEQVGLSGRIYCDYLRIASRTLPLRQESLIDGYDVVEAIEAMNQNKAKVFFGMGGNFISATPDTKFTAEALRNCNLTVQVSTKLNRSHLITGKKAIILPCLGRTEKDFQGKNEQFVSVENSMGVVHQSKGTLHPCPSKLLSEPAIVAGIANATLKNSTTNWSKLVSNYDLIRDKIEATIPGFKDYNKRIRIKGGFYLPNNARDNNFTPTKTGKANFSLNKPSEIQLEKNQFIMMTIRTHDQYNTTIYGLDDRYRGILNERRVVMMNPNDIELAGLKKLDLVDLTSHFNNEERVAKGFLVVPYDIPKQCTATYFPEANVLVSLKSKADISNTPASKTVIISIKKQ